MKKLIPIILTLLLINTMAFGQSEQKEMPASTDSIAKVYTIETLDGEFIEGRLIKIEDGRYHLQTENVGLLAIHFNQVKSLTINDGSANKRERNNAGSNHYLISASPYNLKKGEFSFQDTEVFLLSTSYGITKHFSLGAGLSLVPGFPLGEQIYYVMPKFSVELAPSIQLSVQLTQIFQKETDNTSLLSFNAGFGSRDRHFSIGYTAPLFVDGEGDFLDVGAVTVGGCYRVGKKFSFLLDTYFPIETPDFEDYFALVGIGGRIITGYSAFDIGFLMPTSEWEGVPLPWFNYTFTMPTKKK